jgi:hypothetical protein
MKLNLALQSSALNILATLAAITSLFWSSFGFAGHSHAGQSLESPSLIQCADENGARVELEGNLESGWLIELDAKLSVPYVGQIKKKERMILSLSASEGDSELSAKLAMWDGNVGVELLIPETGEDAFDAELHVFAADIEYESARAQVRCQRRPL